jgi:uncharacterized membrane protein
MLAAGADVRHVAEMLGHQKLDTTMGYTRVSMAKLQEAHARCHPAEQSDRARVVEQEPFVALITGPFQRSTAAACWDRAEGMA